MIISSVHYMCQYITQGYFNNVAEVGVKWIVNIKLAFL